MELIVADVMAHAAFAPYATDPPRTLDEAYRLQDALAEQLTARAGRQAVAGWKIAANAPHLLEKFELEDPLSGRVFKNQTQQSPARLAAATFRQFAFEPEIAAIMKTDLEVPDGPADRQDVISAIDRFVPAIELLDMRDIDMPSINIADVVAQNISNEGAVIGGPGIAPQDLIPASVRTEVRVNGKVELQVTGAAPQDPIDAVIWLARHLAKRGLRLQAGQIVLCGTHCPIWYHGNPGQIVVTMTGLGEVSLSLG
ncbi:MAG: fumarylacetoacetate hydrolase family protein [Pseudomonadota bacterium]